ncbi:MAG: 1-phosphofructokinase family hexose kinase [Firmicutes bacterium]|nr:1-phosphofructokinase family hexose kinase [Bacillota bacterium]
MILAVTMNPSLDKVYAVDDYTIGKVFRPRAMTATAGGKGLNVARVACLLGEEVIATGFLGGSTGAFIEHEVQKQGIESCFIEIDGETRTCINVVDEKNTTSTEILEPGPEVTPADCANFLHLFDTLLERCTVLTASGSLPRGAPVDFYRSLIKRAGLKGKKFILDTSGGYFTEGIKEKPYMIKPNQDEIQSVEDGVYSKSDDYIRLLLSF